MYICHYCGRDDKNSYEKVTGYEDKRRNETNYFNERDVYLCRECKEDPTKDVKYKLE